MGVRAKMRVTGRKEWDSGHHATDEKKVSQVTVTLQAVYDDGANADWSRWTPSGQLELTITNPDAFEQLKLGHTYYVDLNPAE